MKINRAVASLACIMLLSLVAPVRADETAPFTTDKGGFIPYWIGLGPIPVGADTIRGKALDTDYLNGQHAPKPGEKITVAGTELTWSPIQAKAKSPTVTCFDTMPGGDNTLYYMVSYVVSDVEREHVMLSWGSDDGGVVYVNDVEVGRYNGPRMCAPDSDSTREFTLKKGVNTIMIRVQNIGWSAIGVARLTDADENGLAGLKISSTPDDSDKPDAPLWQPVDTNSKPMVGPAPRYLVAGQIGYQTNEEKLAIAASGRPREWKSIQICDVATSQPVFTIPKDGGEILPSERRADVSQSVSRIYFGAFNKPGRYYLYSEENKLKSLPFNISDNPYLDVARAITRCFYFQRQGQNRDEKTAGKWAGPAYHGPDTGAQAKVHGFTGGDWLHVGGPVLDPTPHDVNGGWYDAGDPNKYTKNECLAHNLLLLTYDTNKSYLKDGDLNIPESGNGVPDIVDEARYCTDYLLKIQNEKGEVADRVAHSDNPKAEAQIAEPCSGATWCAIGSLAYAGAVWKEGGWDNTFADRCIAAAEKSWAYMKDNPSPWPKKKLGSIDGGYGDEAGLRNVAAAALYRATGKDEYKQITEDSFKTPHGEQTIGRWIHQILVCNNYMLTKGSDPAIYNAFGQKMASDAETVRKRVMKASKAYSYGSGWTVYCWGSNSGVTQDASGMAWWAAHFAPDREKPLFAQAADEYMQYLLGRNPTRYCYITSLQSIGAENAVQVMFSFLVRRDPKYLTPSADHPERIGCFPGYMLGGPDPNILNFKFNPDAVQNDYDRMEPSIIYQCSAVALANYCAGLAREHRAIKIDPASDPALLTPLAVAPSDPLIRYVGRFDTRDSAGPKCSWAGSGIVAKFQGTAIAAKIRASAGDDYLQVVIDGQALAPLQVANDETFYPIANGLKDGEHTLELTKRTEPSVGTIQFLGLQLQQGKTLLPLPERPRHRIEFVGDSITCGFGDEGANQNEGPSARTENNYLSYGPLTARELGAEYAIIAWSGRTMAPNNTMPEIYDLAVPQDASSKWDVSQWVPDVIVINLGTNDFKAKNPDQKMWTDAYETFIKKLRVLYPKATIVCAEGSMMDDNDPHWHGALAASRKYIADMIDDLKTQNITDVQYVEFDPQQPSDGYGALWHPNLTTHRHMATKLEAELKKMMSW